MPSDNHSEHENHGKHIPWLTLGAAGAAAGITLAPSIVPALGIGDPYLGDDASNLMHVHSVPGQAAVLGTGLAGWVNSGISHIPLIGQTLVNNSYASIAATAIIGIGGVLLANWLEKHEDGSSHIRWSKIIRTVALVTSVLIALPAILTGISTGLTYLGLLGGVEAGGVVAGAMTSTLGAAAGHSAAVSILGATLPHLFLCGAAILPLVFAGFLGKRSTTSSTASSRVEKCGIVADVGGNEPLRAGEDGMLNIALHDLAGRPLTGLQPEMGAMAHLIGISEDREDFIHCHPIAKTAEGMQFHVHPNKAGMTRFFLQLKRNGEEVVLPIDIRIALPAKFAAREADRPAHSHTMAMG